MPWPRFEDGDVEIRFTEKDESYMLHSHVLALHSPWFKASLSERWSQNTTSTGARRIYELRFEESTTIGTLMRYTSVRRTEILHVIHRHYPPGTPSGARATYKRRVLVAKAHQALLGALYHVPPAFGKTWDDAAMLFVESLASTADYYGCSALMRVHIHNHLREHLHNVLTQCSAEPYALLKLGVLVEADWIVKDAATYIIGQNGKAWEKNSARYRDCVGTIDGVLQEKRGLFIQRLKDVELELYRMDPPSTYEDQLATDIFRQWVSDETKAQGPFPKAAYATLYRKLACGRPPVEQTAFEISLHGGQVGVQTYSAASNVDGINDGWIQAWATASQLVKPLLKDVTMLRRVGPSLDTNLRFLTIKDDELPWKQKK